MLFRNDSGCGCGPSGYPGGGYLRALDKRFLSPGPYQANMLGALANLGPRFTFSGQPGYATASGVHQPGALAPITVGQGLFGSEMSGQHIYTAAASAFGALLMMGAVRGLPKGPMARFLGFALLATGVFAPQLRNMFGGAKVQPQAG